MIAKPGFLEVVKVNYFATSEKDFRDRRNIIRKENQRPDRDFAVIGQTTLREGYSYSDGEYGMLFSTKKVHVVYIVADSLGRRYKALLKDLVFTGAVCAMVEGVLEENEVSD